MARDPHGFRPLAMGEMEVLRRAQVLRLRLRDLRLRPDRRRVPARRRTRRDGHAWGRKASRASAGLPSSRARSASSSMSISRGPIRSSSAASVEESRENLGRLLASESPADADVVVPVPDSGVAAAIGYCRRIRACRTARP